MSNSHEEAPLKEMIKHLYIKYAAAWKKIFWWISVYIQMTWTLIEKDILIIF